MSILPPMIHFSLPGAASREKAIRRRSRPSPPGEPMRTESFVPLRMTSKRDGQISGPALRWGGARLAHVLGACQAALFRC